MTNIVLLVIYLVMFHLFLCGNGHENQLKYGLMALKHTLKLLFVTVRTNLRTK
jgi:hypothetical protein